MLWGEALARRSVAVRGLARGVLLVAVLGAAFNSVLHVGDLLEIFADRG